MPLSQIPKHPLEVLITVVRTVLYRLATDFLIGSLCCTVTYLLSDVLPKSGTRFANLFSLMSLNCSQFLSTTQSFADSPRHHGQYYFHSMLLSRAYRTQSQPIETPPPFNNTTDAIRNDSTLGRRKVAKNPSRYPRSKQLLPRRRTCYRSGNRATSRSDQAVVRLLTVCKNEILKVCANSTIVRLPSTNSGVPMTPPCETCPKLLIILYTSQFHLKLVV